MTDIVVIGGGIIGLSIAYHLRDHSSVRVLEQNTLGSGTTAASMGRFNWDAPTPFGNYIQRRAWEAYKPLVDTNEIEFTECGYLRLASTTDELESMRNTACTLREYGLDFEVLDAQATSTHGVAPDAVAGGLFQANGGFLNQHDVVTYYAAHARKNAVDIETGVEVIDIQTKNQAVESVETLEASYNADMVVNATGPWAHAINSMVGVSLPLRHTTGPILVLDSGDPVSIPFLKNVAGPYYFRPEGQTKVLAGRRWGRYDRAQKHDPDKTQSVSEEFKEAIANITQTHVPRLTDANIINEWVGLRTITPDFRPIVGSTDIGGFLVACGMSGSGVGLAPIVGELVASHVNDQPPTTLHDIFSPNRFAHR